MKKNINSPSGSSAGPTPSKTAMKKAMLELQSVGERLLTIPAARLACVPMPDKLREAVMEARKMNKFGALDRQKQYIGKLMRQLDAEPIRQALASIDEENLAGKRNHKLAENWRERLLNESRPALDAFLARYPDCDRQQLRQLIRACEKAHSDIALVTLRKKLYRFVHTMLLSENHSDN